MKREEQNEETFRVARRNFQLSVLSQAGEHMHDENLDTHEDYALFMQLTLFSSQKERWCLAS